MTIGHSVGVPANDLGSEEPTAEEPPRLLQNLARLAGEMQCLAFGSNHALDAQGVR